MRRLFSPCNRQAECELYFSVSNAPEKRAEVEVQVAQRFHRAQTEFRRTSQLVQHLLLLARSLFRTGIGTRIRRSDSIPAAAVAGRKACGGAALCLSAVHLCFHFGHVRGEDWHQYWWREGGGMETRSKITGNLTHISLSLLPLPFMNDSLQGDSATPRFLDWSR